MATVTETGDIHFFFRPVVEQEDPDQLDDVQQFYLVLSPRDAGRHRLLVVGRKRLPEIDDSEPLWAYVDTVTDDPDGLTDGLGASDYQTKTRGQRHQPAARPAGEGVYAITTQDSDARLAYLLELPSDPGPVQEELNIAPQARFVFSVKNPDVGEGARGAGLPESRRAAFPGPLAEQFGGRRWIPVDPPEFLDHPGAELLLVGAQEDAGGTAADALAPESEDAGSADVFTQLRMDRDAHPVAPLLSGEWD